MKHLILLLILGISLAAQAQLSADHPVHQQIMLNDSLIFEASFVNCDLETLTKLTTEDLEFYHDQSGMNRSQEVFIQGTKEGLCKLPYKAWRELLPETGQIFPLYKDGELYGVLQKGTHQFHAKYPEKEAYVSSIAEFSHLWLKDGENWKLSRVISYNHRTP